MPSFKNTPSLPYHSAYFSGSRFAFSASHLTTLFATISPSLRTSALSCGVSREMFSGTSSQSITPLMNRRKLGRTFRAFC